MLGDDFCWRWPLRTGAKFTAITTFVYAAIFLLCGPIVLHFGVEKLNAAAYKDEMLLPKTEVHGRMLTMLASFMLFFAICYAIGGLCLCFSLKKNKGWLVLLWLIFIGMCLFISFVPAPILIHLGQQRKKQSKQSKNKTKTSESQEGLDEVMVYIYIIYALMITMKIFMLYLWFIIFNFRQALRQGRDGSRKR